MGFPWNCSTSKWLQVTTRLVELEFCAVTTSEALNDLVGICFKMAAYVNKHMGWSLLIESDANFTNFSNPTRNLMTIIKIQKISKKQIALWAPGRYVITIKGLFVFLPSMEGLFFSNTVSYTYSHFSTSLPSASVRALTDFACPIPPELTADTSMTYMV